MDILQLNDFFLFYFCQAKGMSANKFNLSLFLTQSYHMTSKDLQ